MERKKFYHEPTRTTRTEKKISEYEFVVVPQVRFVLFVVE